MNQTPSQLSSESGGAQPQADNGELPPLTVSLIEKNPSLIEKLPLERLIVFCDRMNQMVDTGLEMNLMLRRKTLYHAWMAGRGFCKLKSMQGHGSWLKCLKANFPNVSEDTVQRYMKLARKHPDVASLGYARPDRLPGEQSTSTKSSEHREAARKNPGGHPSGWEEVKNKAQQLAVLITKTKAEAGSPTADSPLAALIKLQKSIEAAIRKSGFIPPNECRSSVQKR